MPRQSSARPTRGRLRLKLRSAEVAEPSEDAAGPVPRRLPGWVLAPLAGVVAALVGMVVVMILVLVGWATARAGEVPGALAGGLQLWLLAHGVPIEVVGLRFTLIPLGITILLVVGVARATRVALDQAEGVQEPEESGGSSLARLWLMPALVVLGYTLVVSLAALLAGSPAQVGPAALGGLATAAVGAAWVALRAPELGVRERVPSWSRPIPGAVAGATAVVLLGGAAALTVSVVQHWEHINVINQGLGVDGIRLVPLTLAQLVFWPNMVIWAASWTLGSGFRLGEGSIVAPAGTDLGMVPSIPVLGALPAEGPGTWLLAWLVTGVVAGGVAAALVIRGRRTAGFEEATLVSGLAGVLAALVVTGLGFLSRGDLGIGRMTGLGPRLTELLMMAAALIGLSALVVGLVAGLVRHLLRRGRPLGNEIDEDGPVEDPPGGGEGEATVETTLPEAEQMDDDEPTRALGGRVQA